MRKPLFIAIACIVIGILLLVFVHRPKTSDNSVIIVLSPHYDDASLSLGGLLAKHEHPTIVASFFTGEPTHTDNHSLGHHIRF
jgi:LmbE family N-acetylglucosaminyl deacetylase